MTESRPRRISLAMIEHAGRLLPPERTHWGEAMRSELDHMEGDVESLRWAAGCVVASYFERRRHRMNQQSSSFGAIVRKPSALAPLAMSLAALGVIGIAPASLYLSRTKVPLLTFGSCSWPGNCRC
jgi:hypothetical protein